jgi:hypothetical protein
MEFDLEALQELAAQEDHVVGACGFTCGPSVHCQKTCATSNN